MSTTLIQLQIDFLLPYELTPLKEDLDYELKTYGQINTPATIYEKKGGKYAEVKDKKRVKK